jgi:hypothetical protein
MADAAEALMLASEQGSPEVTSLRTSMRQTCPLWSPDKTRAPIDLDRS